ncbi:hypothetical protein [Streptomyces sp. WAC01280]|uniref:hypothetical protein n=1 Tax=Streptomyces sp. WAC01280 TaxID=2487424 RepID=UPI000F797C40|nr:hypothetical protein [Streptomyces sp. WAC01280]RSS59503.1 hypothetical protein EF909_06380 [Streptomyces sp. WAC01280]
MIENLSSPSDTELKLLAAATAERAAAFCRVMGSEEQQDWIDSGLELAWRMAAGHDGADECADFLDSLVGDDEGEFEDADPTASPGFYAEMAVGLVGEALAVSLRPSVDRIETGYKTMRTLFSMVDFKLSGEKPVIVRSGEPQPAPGPLVQGERDAEERALAILLRERDASGERQGAESTLTELRGLAEAFSNDVTPSLEEFSEANNWS